MMENGKVVGYTTIRVKPNRAQVRVVEQPLEVKRRIGYLPETPPLYPEMEVWEYLTFAGDIPKGEYGGGAVYVWDTGTYETEKFNDNAPDGPDKGGEVIVTLHGDRIDGRYALIQTDGKNWLAHSLTAGFAGTGAMQAGPNTGVNADTGYATTSPRTRSPPRPGP